MTTITSNNIYNEQSFNVPLKLWLPIEEIEQGAMEQLRNAARHPEALDHIAVMPDVHQGYGIPVGSVMVTDNAVIPNAVGVDIGCGVAAVNTEKSVYDIDTRAFWRAWAGQVTRDVPLGFSTHRGPQPLGDLDRRLRAQKLQQLLGQKASLQVGTLGGGNHFLESAKDEKGKIWLLVHSGSRHTGLRIADYYHTLAKNLKSGRNLDTIDDLASLSLDDGTGHNYLSDMQWAADFATESRWRMLRAMGNALGIEISRDAVIDVPHNLAWNENGRVIHRKGATPAHNGQLGIIPGSMGTASFIVKGRGEPESFESCSHGAGRRVSRSKAREQISKADFAASLEGTYSKPSTRIIDEAPGAYKDVQEVVERQRDLVDIVHRLRPIITLKGDSKARED